MQLAVFEGSENETIEIDQTRESRSNDRLI